MLTKIFITLVVIALVAAYLVVMRWLVKLIVKDEEVN